MEVTALLGVENFRGGAYGDGETIVRYYSEDDGHRLLPGDEIIITFPLRYRDGERIDRTRLPAVAKQFRSATLRDLRERLTDHVTDRLRR